MLFDKNNKGRTNRLINFPIERNSLMSNKLFVGGLSFDSTEENLEKYFAQAGSVASVKIINDRYSGKSRGFAFIEMSNSAEAQKAIEMFNNKEFEGRNLIVNIARPPRENSR